MVVWGRAPDNFFRGRVLKSLRDFSRLSSAQQHAVAIHGACCIRASMARFRPSDRHGCLSAADAMDGKEAALKNFVWPLL